MGRGWVEHLCLYTEQITSMEKPLMYNTLWYTPRSLIESEEVAREYSGGRGMSVH